MFADCGFEEKELQDYTYRFNFLRESVEHNTLNRFPDAYLLWDKKVESERVQLINEEISRYQSRYATIMDKVASLQKCLPKLRTKNIVNNVTLRTAACQSMESVLSFLPVITYSLPVFQSQLKLLNEYTEADEILKSLKESSTPKKRMSSLQLLARKSKSIIEIWNTMNDQLDAQLDSSQPFDYSLPFDARNSVGLSMIDADRSMNLLRDVLKSLSKRVEICDPEVQMISNVLWLLYSAMSIMNTLSVDQEYKTVEEAFQTLIGIVNGNTTVAVGAQPISTSETFNRLYDRIVSLLAETIKTIKRQERSGNK